MTVPCIASPRLVPYPVTVQLILPFAIPSLSAANVKILNGLAPVKLATGASLFSNVPGKVDALAAELEGLTAYRMNGEVQRKEGTTIEFEAAAPVNLLVGYFRDDQKKYAKAPKLETDASANDYGQAEPKLTNAIRIAGMPLANVHAYHFETGKHTLLLPKGYTMVLGFTDAQVTPRNAGLAGAEETMDWMFY